MKIKRIIIVLIIIGMIGWASFEFVTSRDQVKQESTVEQNKNLSEDKKKDEAGTESREVGTQIGNIAPDFELMTATGERVKLSDFRGKRVMLNFWATWCPPCRAEIPDMQKFYENEDVEILAVNLTETEASREQVDRFIDEFGMTFRVLLDEELEVANMYAIQPIPTSYMIDSEGVIRFMAPGALNYEFMVNELEKMK